MATNRANELFKAMKNEATFDSSSGNNPNYRVWMWKGKPKDGISTAMPENWSTSLDIGWQPQFANLLQDALGVVIGPARAAAAANMSAAAGYRIQNKILASNIWEGTSYLTINIPFFFKVETNVEKELLHPIRQLMKWALPSGGDRVLLEAPYKPFESITVDSINAATGGKFTTTVKQTPAADPVEVQFGNFFHLKSCVITSISQTYDSIFNKDGKPLSAKIDVTVQSTTIITQEDVAGLFLSAA
jgi:hypothetical protein